MQRLPLSVCSTKSGDLNNVSKILESVTTVVMTLRPVLSLNTSQHKIIVNNNFIRSVTWHSEVSV
jgi:hypothetical protein